MSSSFRFLRHAAWLTTALALVACSGSDGTDGKDGAQGADGKDGQDGTGSGADPSVSGVVPGAVFVGRTKDVLISGFGTNWSDAATVDFGAGVTVDNVTVASPTAILATITVGSSAELGARDVMVKEGDSEVAYKGAFKLESPVEFTLEGTPAQGSLVFFTAKNKDLENPFDTTATGGGLFSAPEFTNVTLAAGAGVAVQINDVQQYSASGVMLIDADAKAEQFPLELLSGPDGEELSFNDPEGVTLAARSPKALGADESFMVDAPFASQLFEFTPASGLKLTTLSVTADDFDASPEMVVLGPTGSFTDFLAQSTEYVRIGDGGDPAHIIYIDVSGTSGYTANIKTTSRDLTAATESEPNNDTATAGVITDGSLVQAAELGSATDEDWFKITVGGADVGKSLTIRTLAGDPQADTFVEVFGSDGTTPFGTGGDTNYHESLISEPLTPAGDYYVKVSVSPEGLVAGQTKYDLVVYFE